jgi:hypothetical protein
MLAVLAELLETPLANGLKLLDRFLWVVLCWVDLEGCRLLSLRVFVVVDEDAFGANFSVASFEVGVMDFAELGVVLVIVCVRIATHVEQKAAAY